MQNKKMTNPTDGINESNKKLRAIYDQLCCLTTTTYNELDTVALVVGATQVFYPGTVHSFSWELGSGATVDISNGSNANDFETNGNVTFSTTNTQTIEITAIGGNVKIIYIY
jgi:hypothetical protein